MQRIIVITHSTSNTGAPKICLSVIKFFRSHYPNSIVDVISLDSGGSLEQEFIELSTNYFSLSSLSKEKNYSLLNRFKLKFLKKKILSEYEFQVQFFKSLDCDLIFANTVVTLPIALKIKSNRSSTKVLLNLLEMSTVIDQLCSNFKTEIQEVDSVLLISDFHKSHIETSYSFKFKTNITIIPPIELISDCSITKKQDTFLKVVMAGSVHWRKGDDVFIQVARKTIAKRKDVKFFWYGPIDIYLKKIIENDLKKLGLEEHVFFMGEKQNPHLEIVDMDIFLLTSREEPFGLAPAEAGLLGLPIIYFKDVTGIGALLEAHNLENGVDYLDIDAMTCKLTYFLDNPIFCNEIGCQTKELMKKFTEQYYWKNLSKHLISLNK